VIRAILNELRAGIHGMVHCTGGAQTKVLHFVENKKVVKDNLFPLPPLFRIIQEQSGSDWQEMYKVFNMGHRMEIYLDQSDAARIIEIAAGYGIEARIIGHVEEAKANQLIIKSEFGCFEYY
jgi:phosphoribosylformylglycinamidine cyclo-ligase